MGYRVFRDSQGIEWHTWDVVPRLAERRETERRREVAVVPIVAVERRQAADRRVVAGRRPILSASLDEGWLCFQAVTGKRRLAPIPRDWLRCDDECLERYCRQARPAVGASVAVDISTLAEFRN